MSSHEPRTGDSFSDIFGQQQQEAEEGQSRSLLTNEDPRIFQMVSSHCDTIDELPEEEESEAVDDDRVKPPPIPARRTLNSDGTAMETTPTPTPTARSSPTTLPSSKRSPLMKIKGFLSFRSNSSSSDVDTIPSMSPKNNRNPPEVTVQTWNERGNDRDEEEDFDSGASTSFSRGSSYRTGFRGSSGRRRQTTSTTAYSSGASPVPMTTTTAESSLCSSAVSSPSLLSANSRNHPRRLPSDLKPEDLRLNLELLQRGDSARSSRTSADFRSLDCDDGIGGGGAGGAFGRVVTRL